MALIVSLSSYLGNIFPSEWITPLEEGLDSVGIDIEGARMSWDEEGLFIYQSVHILEDVKFDFPLIPGSTIEIEENNSGIFTQVRTKPKIEISVGNIDITLKIGGYVIRACEKNEREEWVPKTDEDGNPLGLAITLTLPELKVDISGKITCEEPEIALGSNAVMIGDTGILLDFTPPNGNDNQFDLVLSAQDEERESVSSQDENISNSEPSSDLSTSNDTWPNIIPEDFKGILLKNVTIHYLKEGADLPPFSIQEAAFGTGGFTGYVSLGSIYNADRKLTEEKLDNDSGLPDIWRVHIGGMKAVLLCFTVHFMQCVPTRSRIAGYIRMPFVDKWLRLEASIGGPNGDFMLEVGGTGDAGLVDLNNDWFQIIVDSLRYELRKNERNEGVHYAIIKGSVKPKLAGFDWPTLKVDKLAISSEGDIDLDGGWVDVPETFTLDFHGFKIDIDQLGMGNEEEGARQWLGFSGGITLVEGIPLSASVQGLKFSWNTDSSLGTGLKVSLEGIAVHLEIPNTLELDGSVRYREITRTEAEAQPEGGPSRFYGNIFTGSVTLNITALKTMVNGELLIGDLTDLDTGERFTAFYIVLNAQLPTAIPLGATGTGLYGLAGLFGMHVAPDRKIVNNEPVSWYLWYKEPKSGVNGSSYNVTKVAKWGPRFDNYAFGAGLSLGTVYDDGFTINVGALVVILIPGPVIMIEGRANLLKERGKGETSGKNAEGALYALIVFDGLAETFQMNVDINYTLEDVITVGGGMEAFFDFKDNTKWYIYIGKKDPEAKRIRAEVISIISASAYFMIDPKAFQFGAAAGINLDLEYGPLEIRLIIRIRFEIALFFKQPQLTGLVELYGELTIKIFGIGLSLILQTLLEGSAPQPWWIHGLARAALSLPFPLPSFDVQVEFTWGESDEPARVDLLKGAAMIHAKQIGASWELSTTLENAPTVPVDAIPILSCAKPISMVSTCPAENGGIKWFPSETVEGWEFGYDFKHIEIIELDEHGAKVGPGEIIYAREFNDSLGPTTPERPWRPGGGIYQPPIENNPVENNGGEQVANNIQEPQIKLWGYSPLAALHPGYQDRYVNLCRATKRLPKKHCVHWKAVAAGTAYSTIFSYKKLAFATRLNSSNARVAGDSSGDRGLDVQSLIVRFPEPIASVEITYFSNRAKVSAYLQGKLVGGTGNEYISSPWITSAGMIVDTVHLDAYFDKSVANIPLPVRIISICYITKREQDSFWRGTNQSGGPDSTSMFDTPYLKPKTSYQLNVTAQRRERKEGGSSFTPVLQTQIYYFKTADAPGINRASEEIPTLQSDAEKTEANKIDFRDGPLNRLETYVNRTVPQNGSKLFYRGYRVLVEFNEPYIQNLYEDTLSIKIKDRNGKALLGNDGSNFSGWLQSGLSFLTPGLLTILSAPLQEECRDPRQRPNWRKFEKRYLSCVLPDTVQPGKMYIIEVVSGERVLYQFQFATSRYHDLVEHLQSGLPQDDSGNVINQDQLVRPGLPSSRQLPDISWFKSYFDLIAKIDNERKELWFAVDWSTEANKTIPQAQEAIKAARDNLHQFNVEIFNWLDQGGAHPNPDFASSIYPGVQHLFDAVDLGHRPLPPKIELVQISDENNSGYFLLLESPEPLEWQRLKLTIKGKQLLVIWNNDQTRAFIFNMSTEGKSHDGKRVDGMFEKGTYPFTLECDRGGNDRAGMRTVDLEPLYKSEPVNKSDPLFEEGNKIKHDSVTWNVKIG